MLAALQTDDKPSRAYTTTIAVCRHLSILAPAQYSSICAPMPHNSSCRVLPDILSVYPYSQIAALRSYTEAHSPSITQNAPANCTKSNSRHAQTLPPPHYIAIHLIGAKKAAPKGGPKNVAKSAQLLLRRLNLEIQTRNRRRLPQTIDLRQFHRTRRISPRALQKYGISILGLFASSSLCDF